MTPATRNLLRRAQAWAGSRDVTITIQQHILVIPAVRPGAIVAHQHPLREEPVDTKLLRLIDEAEALAHSHSDPMIACLLRRCRIRLGSIQALN